MRRIGRSIWFVAALLSSGAAEAEPFQLGVILPLSGEAAIYGRACQNGVELALRGPNAGELQVVYEDDANTPKNTLNAFSKLTTQNGVGGVLIWSSPTANAVAPLADRQRIPIIAIASDAKVVEGRKYAVNLWVTPEQEAETLHEELQRRGIDSVARITSIQDGTISIRNAFDRVVGKEVKLLLDEEYAADARDYRPFLIKAKARHDLDAVIVNLFVGQVGLFARQARELGMNLPLIGIETFEDEGQVKLSQGALVGQWYVQADDPSGEFLKLYRERFPEASPVTAANCHDAVLMVADAHSKGIPLNQYLHTVRDFNGALGTYSATTDNKFSLPAIVKVVTQTGFERVTVPGSESAR